jgi:DNA (cytosine-5)-methyltransferase 1
MRKFKTLSLFSGAGGLDEGFVQSGYFDIIFSNDILPQAMKTHSKNFGLKLSFCGNDKVEAHGGMALACDIERVDLSPLKGTNIDVIIGGPPCQDFSVVRGPNRKGIEVKRGRLYSFFVKALAQLQPKAFLFENVYGLVSANKGIAYRYILEDFANLNLRWEEVKRGIEGSDSVRPSQGYHIIHSEVLDLSHFGVPQRRERLIIVGIRKDLVKDGKQLWEIKSTFFKALKESMGLFPKYPLSTIETFEGKRLDELDDVYKDTIKKWDGVWLEVGTRKAWEWKAKVWNKLTFDVVTDYLKANEVKSPRKEELEEALKQHEDVLKELGYYGVPVNSLRPIDGSNDLPDNDLVVIERMRRIPFDENYEFVKGTKWEVDIKSFSHMYKRLHPLKPSYTILAYGGGGSHGYHYDRDRASLTLRERARIQTFPDSFLFVGTKTEIKGQIGEAVPPLAAKRLAQALSKVLLNFE